MAEFCHATSQASIFFTALNTCFIRETSLFLMACSFAAQFGLNLFWICSIDASATDGAARQSFMSYVLTLL
jgi:hypothetical protein